MATFLNNTWHVLYRYIGDTTNSYQLGSTTSSFSTVSPLYNNWLFGAKVNALAQLLIFQGTVPTNFTTFTSISTRINDLLVVIPVGGSSNNTSVLANTTQSRWLTGVSTGTSRTLATSALSRSSNVVTVTTSITGHGLAPGQSVTISGAVNTAFNGTFVIVDTPSTTTFTYNQTDVDASTTGATVTIPYTAIRNGTATWFCMCRFGIYSNITVYTPFTDYGAMIGTVGIPGSSSDLIIDGTSIIQGTTYTSGGFYINFPATNNV